MAPQASLENRWLTIRQALASTLQTLKLLADALDSSILTTISTTTGALLIVAESLKWGKKECTELLEVTYQILEAIVAIHMESETGGDLSPTMLYNLGNFARTVNIIYSFLETQQTSSRVKMWFSQNEKSQLYKACRTGLEEASTKFKISTVTVASELVEMRHASEERHKELLALIGSQSDTSSIGSRSSLREAFSNAGGSSNSLKMLPSKPQIFHGRDGEVSEILKLFALGVPRIAILGAGGMGKTSLAREILHQNEIASRFKDHCFFVACESALTADDLVNIIAAYLGVKPARNLRTEVLHWLSKAPETLLVLDNLETVWEPFSLRSQVEELLSLLAGIEHLALMITLRGAERPAKVQWSRPFLKPLHPLPASAAYQTFTDIADDVHEEQEVQRILELTDNLPLAVSLVAHLVDSEGTSSVLSRWEQEKTSLLSGGHDKRSNLDLSISLSLSSPRTTFQSIQLLSLLSLLPDGISEVELSQAKLPILHETITSLLRTSLAYMSEDKHLKALAPIREYMQKLHPPPKDLVQMLSQHYRELAHICRGQWGTPWIDSVAARLQADFGNIQNMIWWEMEQGMDRTKIVEFILDSNFISRQSDRAIITMLAHVPDLLPEPLDHNLKLRYLTEVLQDLRSSPPDQAAIDEALRTMHQVNDIEAQSLFHYALAWRYDGTNNHTSAIQACQDGVDLLRPDVNPRAECLIMQRLSHLKWRTGDYVGGQIAAQRAFWLGQLCGNFRVQSSVLFTQALCCTSLGKYTIVVALCEEARSFVDRIGRPPSARSTLFALQAEVHFLKTEYTDAHAMYTESIGIISQQHSPYEYATTLLHLGDVGIEMGVPQDTARRNIEAAREILGNMGAQRDMMFSALSLVNLSCRDGCDEGKMNEYERLFRKFEGRDPEFLTYCLERLAQGYRHRLTIWPFVQLAHSIKFKRKLDIHKALQSLAHDFLLQEDIKTAQDLFVAALDGFTYMDVHRNSAECMLELGEIAKNNGDFRTAKELWISAKPRFERSSQTRQRHELEERLTQLQRAG